jgi:beta-glucoside kinase
MKQYLTMDIGGTFIKHSIMNQDFTEIEAKSVPTEKDPDKFLDQLLQIIHETTEKISGIAISMGGFINPQTGLNTDFSVGENFKKYNLKEKIEEKTGYPVSIENDSNCAALAELYLGAGKDCRDLCMITLGTGIGGAIIHNRELFRGRNFKAGEFGFTMIGREKEKGEYSYRAASATSTLVRRVSAAINQSIDGNYVFDHLEEPIIKSIYEEWLQDLAMVVGNIAVCFDPEKVLIGGGISTRDSFILELRSKVYQIYRHLEEYTAIEACTLGNHAGKIGALLMYRKQYESGEEITWQKD